MIAFAFVLLAVATSGNAPVGFIDVSRLIASHPLHTMLAQYDREIAALQSTLRVPALGDLAARARKGASEVRDAVASAQTNVLQNAAETANADRAHERAALSSITPSQQSYAAELSRETRASIAAYSQAIAQRDARALAARRAQLHEKELALAYDLARAGAGKRLALTLKLQHLHLDRADRTALEDRLSALNRSDSIAIGELRAEDAGVLAAYARDLRRDAATENSHMAAQLRAKAAANLALRQHVLRVDPQQAATFAATYRDPSDAAAIAAAMRVAGSDISVRFGALAQSASQSQNETIAVVSKLKRDRDTLLRAMIAQIRREGALLVQARHLARLDTSTRAPKNSVDLTGAVRAALSRS